MVFLRNWQVYAVVCICMLVYRVTHLKVRIAAVFTVHAVNSQFDLMSLAELGVDQTVLSSRAEKAFSFFFFQVGGWKLRVTTFS